MYRAASAAAVSHIQSTAQSLFVLFSVARLLLSSLSCSYCCCCIISICGIRRSRVAMVLRLEKSLQERFYDDDNDD